MAQGLHRIYRAQNYFIPEDLAPNTAVEFGIPMTQKTLETSCS